MIVDTNMLIEIVKNNVRVQGKLKTMLPCVKELANLDTKESRLALKFVDKKVKVIDSDLPADDAIVEYASEEGLPVATNDKELIKRLKEKNIKVLRLRQRRYLVEA